MGRVQTRPLGYRQYTARCGHFGAGASESELVRKTELPSDRKAASELASTNSTNIINFVKLFLGWANFYREVVADI